MPKSKEPEWKKSIVYVYDGTNENQSTCNHSTILCGEDIKLICHKIERQFQTSNVKQIATCQYEPYFFDGQNIFCVEQMRGHKKRITKLSNLEAGLRTLHCGLYQEDKNLVRIETIFNVMLKNNYPSYMLIKRFNENDLDAILDDLNHTEHARQFKKIYWQRRAGFVPKKC